MVSALADGDIDIIVSAHDPQDVDTKRLPFADAENGAIGLETLLAAALRLYHSGDVTLMRLVDAMSTRPAQILGLDAGTLSVGARADIALFDPEYPWVLSKDDIVSKSKNRPFEDAGLAAKCCKHWLQVSQFIAPEADLFLCNRLEARKIHAVPEYDQWTLSAPIMLGVRCCSAIFAARYRSV
jgi:dihydroorotase-like cyclic amidohydrolase